MNIPDVNTVKPKPWYKEFWLWVVLAPLIVVVLMSIFTVSIAVIGADKPVEGRYKKQGRSYVELPEDDSHLKGSSVDVPKR